MYLKNVRERLLCRPISVVMNDVTDNQRQTQFMKSEKNTIDTLERKAIERLINLTFLVVLVSSSIEVFYSADHSNNCFSLNQKIPHVYMYVFYNMTDVVMTLVRPYLWLFFLAVFTYARD